MKNVRNVFVQGVGMTKFHKPDVNAPTYVECGKLAVQMALDDANLSLNDMDCAIASYCYGDPTCGQRVLLEIGATGLPVYNTNNNCSSGSAALNLGRELIKAGKKAVLIFGFEQMERGLSNRYPEKPNPVGKHIERLYELGAPRPIVKEGMDNWTSDVIKMFACAAQEYTKLYPNTPASIWSEIAYKNRCQGSKNPRTVLFGKSLPNDGAKFLDAPNSPLLLSPITTGMSSLTSTGAAAAVLVSDELVRRTTGNCPLVKLAAQSVTSDTEETFNAGFMDLVGTNLASRAAQSVYRESGLSPQDIDILEVHDCFSPNELFMYEALGLCKPGEGASFFKKGSWKRGHYHVGDKYVINPSGGLESKGHPIGATGLGQCFELVRQLRGKAGESQIGGKLRVALQHNYGLGSACVVSLYTAHNYEEVFPLNAKL